MKKRKYRLGKNIFETHTLFVKDYGNGHTEHILAIEEPIRMYKTVRIINIQGYTIFSGDWNTIILQGHNLIPTKDYDGHFSDSYMLGKLRMGTYQDLLEFDEEGTLELIDAQIAEYNDPEEDNGMVEADIEYLNDLKEFIGGICSDAGGLQYEVFAMDNATPYFTDDYDLIPLCKKPKMEVNVYFDAFEEMCYRLKNDNFVDLSENKDDA